MPEPRSITKEDLIPPSMVRELFEYDAAAGRLRWRLREVTDRYTKVWNKNFAGRIAGNERADRGGRRVRTVTVRKLAVYEHRLVWAYVTGTWPRFSIDHIDGDATNNCISNLRDVPHKDNCRNRGIPRHNKSGHVGVFWDKRTSKWVAGIRADNKAVHLGSFATLEEAVAVRKQAEREAGFHQNHGRNAGA